MRTFTHAAAVLLVLTLLPGCSGTPAHDPARPAIPSGENRTPSDFALAATLFTGENAPGDLEPIRFVIQPDGVLRAARGAGVSMDVLPPRTRNLNQSQLSMVYTQAVRKGLDRGIGGLPYTPGQQPTVAEDAGILIVEFTAHDTRKVSAYDLAEHDGARSLVTTLRQLARIE